jgi:hypothetical protein
MIGSNVMSISMNDTPLIWNDKFRSTRASGAALPRQTVSPPRQLVNKLTTWSAPAAGFDRP